jgi:hypothetical protein
MPYFKKAERKEVPLRISIAGRSGSGKTYSSLLMAKGLTGGDMTKVFVIDTEGGRASRYASDSVVGGFMVMDLNPPFTIEKFDDAIMAANNEGASCIVVDSFSMEWTACLDQAAAIMAGNEKKSMVAWAKIKPKHRALINKTAYLNAHIIFTLRAGVKAEITEETQPNGYVKQVIKPSDLPEPSQEKEFIYEMDFSVTLLKNDDGTHTAIYTKINKDLLPIVNNNTLINVQMGADLNEWNKTGVALTKEEKQQRLEKLRQDFNKPFQEWDALMWGKWNEKIRTSIGACIDMDCLDKIKENIKQKMEFIKQQEQFIDNANDIESAMMMKIQILMENENDTE